MIHILFQENLRLLESLTYNQLLSIHFLKHMEEPMKWEPQKQNLQEPRYKIWQENECFMHCVHIQCKVPRTDYQSSLINSLEERQKHFIKNKNSQAFDQVESFLKHMVPGGGIEPTTLSLEGFCSSTELPGRKNPENLRTSSLKKFVSPLSFSLLRVSQGDTFLVERIVRNIFLSNSFLLTILPQSELFSSLF